MVFGGQHTMWTLVLFDLPTYSKEARKDYTRFRKQLIKNGFAMMQYSVYMRHHASGENANVHIERVKRALPPDGEVRLLQITDKQFGKIQVFYGKRKKSVEKAPAQLEFF